MKPETSSGHDNISTKLIKLSINNIIEPLTNIINTSLSTGIIPNLLKITKLIPIRKQSDKQLLTNYCPTSLLPAFSKIFEKVVFNTMINYMDSQDVFYEYQYITIYLILHFLNNCADVNNKQQKLFTLHILQLIQGVWCDKSWHLDKEARVLWIQGWFWFG